MVQVDCRIYIYQNILLCEKMSITLYKVATGKKTIYLFRHKVQLKIKSEM